MADISENVRLFQRAIEGPLRESMYVKYPDYMNQYVRFRDRNGPTCPFCKAAAKVMFVSELNQKGQDLLNRIQSGNWEGYE